MSNLFRQFGDTVHQLAQALARLEPATRLLQLPPLAGREWYDLLLQKLLPQLQDDAFLVVAVVGGTNIGKSVVFNHLAGCRASATSPLASGTKHPVCLVPPGFAQNHDLPSIFPGFELREWDAAGRALEDHREHLLFWRDSPETAANLLVLDTPDIDSDASVNWERADQVRRCADILIAVLTQQKYNDAAVKQFFRKAASEDKAVVVVFNQCELPDDEAFWPLWLGTFCRETGLSPEFVYVTPRDRRAAEENRLPFYERPWFQETLNGDSPGSASELETRRQGEFRPQSSIPAESNAASQEPRSPKDDLSRFRFAEVKLRTLRGSLQHIAKREEGLPVYLAEVRNASGAFKAAADRLGAESVVRVTDWPNLPSSLFVEQVRAWWQSQQSELARKIGGVYSTVTKGVLWPFKKAREIIQGEPKPPFDLYREREWSALLNAVTQVFEKLEFMSESGNELLRPHFTKLLAGASRESLISQLRESHQQIDLPRELDLVVRAEMERFRVESPDQFRLLKNVNDVTAFARPMTSVVLFSIGFGPAGEAIAPAAAGVIAHAVGHVAFDLAGGAAAAAAGEMGAEVAGRGVNFLQAKMQRLEKSFTQRRLNWLVQLLKSNLLGTLPEDLSAAASIPEAAEFRAVEELLRQLERQLAAFR